MFSKRTGIRVEKILEQIMFCFLFYAKIILVIFRTPHLHVALWIKNILGPHINPIFCEINRNIGHLKPPSRKQTYVLVGREMYKSSALVVAIHSLGEFPLNNHQ